MKMETSSSTTKYIESTDSGFSELSAQINVNDQTVDLTIGGGYYYSKDKLQINELIKFLRKVQSELD
jgi:ligand-binding sensor protein